MANKRTSLAPPSDDELASAEVIDMQKKRDRMELIEQEQETARLARAGDPEAKEALRALNSVLSSTPAGEENETGTEQSNHPQEATAAAPKSRKTRPATTNKRSAKTRRDPERQEQSPEVEEKDPEESARIDETRAYKLMDTAYQKWAKGAKSNLSKANRELAMDLGRDTALYLRTGIIRLGDLHDVINKLTAAKAGKEDNEDAADFDEEMESMRKALRANADGD